MGRERFALSFVRVRSSTKYGGREGNSVQGREGEKEKSTGKRKGGEKRKKVHSCV